MPTRIYEVTDAPVNLLAALDVDGQPLDLEIGKRYVGRYTAIGPQNILNLDFPDRTEFPEHEALWDGANYKTAY